MDRTAAHDRRTFVCDAELAPCTHQNRRVWHQATGTGTARVTGTPLVGDGPYRKAAPKFEWNAIPKIFSYKKFRSAAFGYFGHMWELYAMWTFVPILLSDYFIRNHIIAPVSLWSFIIIGMGGAGCIIGGYIS